MSGYLALTIERMPEGGFVVSPGRSEFNRSDLLGPLFACTGMGEALAFVGRQLEPAANRAKGAAIGAAGGVLIGSAPIARDDGNPVKAAPAGYRLLQDWEGACRCVKIKSDGDGNFYCCKGELPPVRPARVGV